MFFGREISNKTLVCLLVCFNWYPKSSKPARPVKCGFPGIFKSSQVATKVD